MFSFVRCRDPHQPPIGIKAPELLFFSSFSHSLFRGDSPLRRSMGELMRKPLKALPTYEDYLDRRARAYQAATKKRRQQQLREARGIDHPYRGEQYYYVIHGHGAVPTTLRGKSFQLPGVEVVFYCGDGETTQATKQRHGVNAGWPQLLKRLELGSTLPMEYAFETVQSGQTCAPLLVFPGHDIPDNGVYFFCRTQPGEAPYIRDKLCPLPTSGDLILNLITKVIKPDAAQRKLDPPISIHWIACRA